MPSILTLRGHVYKEVYFGITCYSFIYISEISKLPMMTTKTLTHIQHLHIPI